MLFQNNDENIQNIAKLFIDTVKAQGYEISNLSCKIKNNLLLFTYQMVSPHVQYLYTEIILDKNEDISDKKSGANCSSCHIYNEYVNDSNYKCYSCRNGY